jgi:hypothetical protein
MFADDDEVCVDRSSMAKSASPVRLQDDLMRRAALAGARHHRSAAQQIEYWASLGREVAALLDPDRLLAVQAGLASSSSVTRARNIRGGGARLRIQHRLTRPGLDLH